MKSYDYVKNYIYLNRSEFIELVKSFRNENLTEYKVQKIDSNYFRLVNFYTKNYVGLDTTKDGNCLFHAVSLNLIGSKLNTFKIKLVVAFICFEYKVFIRTFLTEYNYQFNYET